MTTWFIKGIGKEVSKENDIVIDSAWSLREHAVERFRLLTAKRHIYKAYFDDYHWSMDEVDVDFPPKLRLVKDA